MCEIISYSGKPNIAMRNVVLKPDTVNEVYTSWFLRGVHSASAQEKTSWWLILVSLLAGSGWQ